MFANSSINVCSVTVVPIFLYGAPSTYSSRTHAIEPL